ncbi:MAG: type I CRISPR-associated protein Cas7, partial [Planctomycetaceae bacterium]|nr:type I CRISPR-associated protein Cas7 [Planctomycetaceae bacterium]
IQFGMARSIEPIVTQEHAVTRCAVTKKEDLEKERTIGRKFTIPYGLYRVHGFINPHLAAQTGFNENGEDLDLFWAALRSMFESDRSAARGEMAPQKLIAFEHSSALGNAPAAKLFDRVTIGRISIGDDAVPARSFNDFNVQVNEQDLPEGITVHHLI